MDKTEPGTLTGVTVPAASSSVARAWARPQQPNPALKPVLCFLFVGPTIAYCYDKTLM